MSRLESLKRSAFAVFKSLQMDKLFRYINGERILVLAYHGVTKKRFIVEPWTLIPLESFEEQIKYVSSRFNILTLHDAVKAIMNGGALPVNPAVITFDDGYKNNYTLALPILQKYDAPATIFLTAGYIGSKEILPLDEAYLIITHCRNRCPITLSEIELGPLYFENTEDLLESYHETVRILKRLPVKDQKEYLSILKKTLNSNYEESKAVEEFLLLSEKEIIALMETGLIQFGAHTISHEICTNIPFEVARKEIIDSRSIIQNILGREVNLFAYPNGTIADYNDEHIRCLKENGFICSVTTTPRLNDINTDLYQIGRICIGPELSSNIDHFALKVSGFISALKSIGNHAHV